MKTVKQWLNDADYFWKKQALDNMIHPNKLVGSLSEAIAYAFIWDNSPEKVEFWLTITSYVKLEEEYNKELENMIIKAKIQALLNKGVTYVWYPGLLPDDLTIEHLLDNPVYHAFSLNEVMEYAASEGKLHVDEYTFYDLQEEIKQL